MSKSKHNKFDYNYEDEGDISRTREEKKDRRKQRRLKNALKTKNISELIRYDEEDDI